MTPMDFIIPDWPAPPSIGAASTTRQGGASVAPFDSFNLAGHVGDAPEAVAANRALLVKSLALPAEPFWLSQMHDTTVVDAAHSEPGVEADASVAFGPGVVCAVMTADCLPVLLCHERGDRVGVVHAGWRGLSTGVLEAAVRALGGGDGLMAWLGPAIGPEAFQVGGEVREAFLDRDPGAAIAFQPDGERWLADLYTLARRRLAARGVTTVHGGGWCTFSDARRFFSYRREPRTGRMASLIWIKR
jgi:polyphenol oxidase